MIISKLDSNAFAKKFNLNIPSNTEIYSLRDNNIVGYTFITDTKENPIYIHILEQYRSNGYGTKLFKETIKIIKEKNKYHEITLSISNSNQHINNIIKNNGGIEISSNQDYTTYIIPINKTS